MDRETFRRQFAEALNAGYSPRQVQEVEERLAAFTALDDELKGIKAEHALAKKKLELALARLGGRYAFAPGVLAIKLSGSLRQAALPGTEEDDEA